MSISKLKREIEIVQKALKIDPNPNYRFSTWGEFNEGYLIFLSDMEREQYSHLVIKFAVIHEYDKKGQVPTIHGPVLEFRELVDKQVGELE